MFGGEIKYSFIINCKKGKLYGKGKYIIKIKK